VFLPGLEWVRQLDHEVKSVTGRLFLADKAPAVQDFGLQIWSRLIGAARYVKPCHHFCQVLAGGYDAAILARFHDLAVQPEQGPELLNVPAVRCHRGSAAAAPQLSRDHLG